MSLYDAVRDLPLEIEEYALEGLELQARADFLRKTTVIHLQGGGEEGIGEDVTYHGEEHDSAQARGPVLPLAGSWTLHTFSRAPGHAVALRAGARAARVPRLPALGIRERRARPRAPPGGSLTRRRGAARGATGRVRRLDGTGLSSLDRALRRVDSPLSGPCASSSTRTPSGRDELIAELAATGAVDSVDLKGQYRGTVVDAPADAGAVPARRRGATRRVARGSGADTGDGGSARAAPRPGDLGRDHPFGRGHREPALAAEDGEREALPLRLRGTALRRLRLLRGARDRRLRRRSVGARAGPTSRSSCLPRSSTPDTPNDVAPREFNLEPQAGLPASPLRRGAARDRIPRAVGAAPRVAPPTSGCPGSRRPRSAEATRASRSRARPARPTPSRW